MTRDHLEWVGCDAERCPAEITGPARRLAREARAAGWVHNLVEVWMSEDDGGETWVDLCPQHAAYSYTLWASEYAEKCTTAPWPAALNEAGARVDADTAAASLRTGRGWAPQEIEDGDVEPITVLTAAILLLGGWLLLPEVTQIGPRVAETVRWRVWPNPDAITLPGPALAKIGPSERAMLKHLHAADDDSWRRWTHCLSRILDDRPRDAHS